MRVSTLMPLLAAATTMAAPQQPNITNITGLPMHFGLVIFPFHQSLDVFGPMDVFNSLALLFKLPMQVSILAKTLDPMSSSPKGGMNMSHGDFGEAIMPTITFADYLAGSRGDMGDMHKPGGHDMSTMEVSARKKRQSIHERRHEGPEHEDMTEHKDKTPCTKSNPAVPAVPAATAPAMPGHDMPAMPVADSKGDIDVLIIPGGGGTRQPMTEEIAFVKAMYPKVKYILTVCTGATIAARAGVLDSRKATTNKRAWTWATSTGPTTNWVGKARWVDDGNVWSSSGVSAGSDMAYAWVSKVYGDEVADFLAKSAEYNRVLDGSDDPFAAIWDVPV
jgi:putative intracellular protease/amidase